MERERALSILLAAACLAGSFSSAAAQTVRIVTPTPPQAKEIKLVERPIPFSLSGDGTQQSISFRKEVEMTEKDRNLFADAQSSISEHAGFAGLEFNAGTWSYEQVVCPALPNHIFLRFTRNNGSGDESMFSASIPRNGGGRVRIIPIRMRGYSLFSPAPINALTISAFNHIRAEEHADIPQQWLGIGLCYAALAGGHPAPPAIENLTDEQKFPVAMPAKLEILSERNVNISFVDVSEAPHPMEWTMFFDSKGKLLKATHKPAELIPSKVIHPAPIEVKGSAGPGDAATGNSGTSK